MNICYSENKNFKATDIKELFSSVNWSSADYPERIVQGLKNSQYVISAWDGEKLVGLVRALSDGSTVAFLHYLLVRPEYQKYHIGSALMESIMKKLSDTLYVKIMPSDPATIGFYKRFGFEQQDNYSAMLINRMGEIPAEK